MLYRVIHALFCISSSCVDELTELMTLLEDNPTVEFSSLILDEDENFKVWNHTCIMTCREMFDAAF